MKKYSNTAAKIDTAERIAEIIIEQLDKGTSPWHKDWKGNVPQSVDGRPYRGINLLLMGMLPYATPKYLTFNKCKELGGMVKKGEHGHLVVYWKRYVKVEKDEATGEETNRMLWFLRPYTVFNVEQCEGLPESCYKMGNVKEHQPIAEAEAIWNGYEDKPETEFTDEDRAFYRPSDDSVHVPSMKYFNSPEGFYATLFHEGVHSTGHKSRLNRTFGEFFGTEQYSKEELVAEIGAQLLCQNCGITRTLDNSIAYCKSWAKCLRGMKAKEIIGAAGRAQKAVDWIMGNREKHEEPKSEKEIA